MPVESLLRSFVISVSVKNSRAIAGTYLPTRITGLMSQWRKIDMQLKITKSEAKLLHNALVNYEQTCSKIAAFNGNGEETRAYFNSQKRKARDLADLIGDGE